MFVSGFRPAIKEELDLFYTSPTRDKSAEYGLRDIQSYAPFGGQEHLYGPFQNVMPPPLSAFGVTTSEREKVVPNNPVYSSFADKSHACDISVSMKEDSMETSPRMPLLVNQSICDTSSPVSVHNTKTYVQLTNAAYDMSSSQVRPFDVSSNQTLQGSPIPPTGPSLSSEPSQIVCLTYENGKAHSTESLENNQEAEDGHLILTGQDKIHAVDYSYNKTAPTEGTSGNPSLALLKQIGLVIENGKLNSEGMDESGRSLLDAMYNTYQKFMSSDYEDKLPEEIERAELNMEHENSNCSDIHITAENTTEYENNQPKEQTVIDDDFVNHTLPNENVPNKNVVKNKRLLKQLTNTRKTDIENKSEIKCIQETIRTDDIVGNFTSDVNSGEEELKLENESNSREATNPFRIELDEGQQVDNRINDKGSKYSNKTNRPPKRKMNKTQKTKHNRYGINRNLRLHSYHRKCTVVPLDLDAECYSRSENGYFCSDCKFVFHKKNKFLIHKKLKAGEICVPDCIYCDAEENKDVHHCLMCPKVFETTELLERHVEKHSTKLSICNYCHVTFATESDLKIHTKQEHSDELQQTFLCDLCGSKFKEKKILNAHRKYVHTEERPESCPTCGRRFKTKSQLKNHLVTHMSATDLQLSCEVCGKMFTRVATLKDHVRRHKKEFTFFCEVCKKGFYRKHGMEEHMRVHTGDKPYNCKFCEFKCALSCNLVKHMKIHKKQGNTQ